MDQAKINQKVRLGWVVIAIFLLQSLVVLVLTFMSVIPKAIQFFKLIFFPRIEELYYETLYFQLIVPMKYFLIKRQAASQDAAKYEDANSSSEVSMLAEIEARVQQNRLVYN